MEEKKQKILDFFSKEKVELIYIFGSYAKGINNENSDIDIAVLFSKDKTDLEIYYIKQELVDILELEVDLINLAKANIIIKNQIVTKGINIFTKEIGNDKKYTMCISGMYNQYREDSKVVREKIKERGYVWKK